MLCNGNKNYCGELYLICTSTRLDRFQLDDLTALSVTFIIELTLILDERLSLIFFCHLAP